MRSRLIIVLAATVVLVAWSAFELQRRNALQEEEQARVSYERREGRLEALSDIATGRPRWKVLGRVANYEIEKKLLLESLKIDMDWFEGCMPTEAMLRYQLEYNSAVYEYAVDTFGAAATQNSLGVHPRIRDREFRESSRASEEPNQAVESTPTAVTPAADASVAPSAGVPHH